MCSNDFAKLSKNNLIQEEYISFVKTQKPMWKFRKQLCPVWFYKEKTSFAQFYSQNIKTAP